MQDKPKREKTRLPELQPLQAQPASVVLARAQVPHKAPENLRKP